jgi:hypothetical protein
VVTVAREIERKYDPATAGPAALDAVKSMTGSAGVAAVSQQGERLLDAGAVGRGLRWRGFRGVPAKG